MGSLTLTTKLVARGPGTAFVLTEEQVQVIGEGARRVPEAKREATRDRRIAQTLEMLRAGTTRS